MYVLGPGRQTTLTDDCIRHGPFDVALPDTKTRSRRENYRFRQIYGARNERGAEIAEAE